MFRLCPHIFFIYVLIVNLVCQTHDFPTNYYARNNEHRTRGDIYKDLQYILSKIRANRDRLKVIYLEEPEYLKKEKVSQAKTQYYRSKELCKVALALIAEHRTEYVKDTPMLNILEQKIKKVESEIHTYSTFITKLHPLELYARNFHLRPGKLLEFRKFQSINDGSIISGRELVKALKKAYFHFNLRTKTNLSIAEKKLQSIIDEYPKFLPAAFWLARVHFDQERIEDAQRIMKRLIEVDPSLVISKSLDARLLAEDDLIDYSISKMPIITHDYDPIDLSQRITEPTPSPHIIRTAFAFCLPGGNSAVSAGGLDLAQVIYEYGHNQKGSRLLALVGQTERKSNLIGPIVELHPVDLEQIYYLDPLIIHNGILPSSKKVRADIGIGTIDREIGYDFFLRKDKQEYPLQFYTSLDRMETTAYRYRKIAGNAGRGLKFSSVGHPYDENRIRAVHIPVAKNYTVSYLYNQEIGAYERLINGNLHLDAFSRNKITSTNIIVQKLNTSISNNDGLVSMQVFGEGPAVIMVKGRLVSGFWRKDKLGSETRYLNEDREEILLSPGRTFIHLIPSSTEVRIDTFDKI